MLNHAGDGDLKELIHEAITTSQEEMKEVAELLKENGVGLPPSPPARPVADLESIPQAQDLWIMKLRQKYPLTSRQD